MLQIPSPKPLIPSPKSLTPSPESRVPSPESRVPSPESRNKATPEASICQENSCRPPSSVTRGRHSFRILRHVYHPDVVPPSPRTPPDVLQAMAVKWECERRHSETEARGLERIQLNLAPSKTTGASPPRIGWTTEQGLNKPVQRSLCHLPPSRAQAL